MGDKSIIIGRVINVIGDDWSLGGNRLVGFRNCIAPISAWLRLRYCEPLSLVLVAGRAGRSGAWKCEYKAGPFTTALPPLGWLGEIASARDHRHRKEGDHERVPIRGRALQV
jgi:hypothetical protein